MTLMYDSITPAAIPPYAAVVGGYINGKYAWSLREWQMFAGLWNPIQVFIPGRTVNPMADAEAAVHLVRDIWGLKAGATISLDLEASDAAGNADYARRWAATVSTLRYSPTGYTSTSTAGYLEGFDDLWIATPNGERTWPGAAAAQFAFPGPYDLSDCQPGWPRRHTPTKPVDIRPSHLQVVDDGFIVLAQGATHG